jgi:predicted small secreted protein
MSGMLFWATERLFDLSTLTRDCADTKRTEDMTKLIASALLLGALALSGCAPLVGAGAVVLADEAAEQEGGNLF